jgi:outer membrane biosynthesis protein TonB
LSSQVNRARRKIFSVRSFRRRSQADAQRRLSVAIVISVLFHAAVLFAVGSHLLFRQTSPKGWGSVVLQAVLQNAATQPDAIAPAILVTQPAEGAKEVVPVEPPKIEPPGPIGAKQSAPTPSLSVAPGAIDPRHGVSGGMLLDPAKLGARYAAALRQHFPDPPSRRPQLKSPPVLAYPRAAIETRTQARITAILTIDERGEIIEKSIVPYDPVFGPAVSEALEDTNFLPAETDGTTVRYWAILEFEFWIDGARAEVGARKR